LSILIPLEMTNYGRSSYDVFQIQLSFRYVSMYRAAVLDEK